LGLGILKWAHICKIIKKYTENRKDTFMKKILIVDDSLFMRKVIFNILQTIDNKSQLLEAATGKDALSLFKSEKPDLVLLDIVMSDSEEEGVKVLEKILKIDPSAKVVMITAVGQDLIIEECKKLGAKDYITKPFSENKIALTVKKYV